ncbi:PREDICTED: uncharacterized protein LOC109584898 [Amphimedon queenslandica]|nr:PREDICTED: uncharacterized protein LOC109584898 [Amphimedon queenslandica]|eukprot:XP_019856365.1 PREDICTED: uncharacterized protein LOC109584898 [Amphimedon queenslandica]
MIASVTTTLIPQSTQTNGTCYSFTDNGTYTVYAHDIENGLIILTPAVVIQYTVDWIEPSDTVFSSIESLDTKCNKLSSNNNHNSVLPNITNTNFTLWTPANTDNRSTETDQSYTSAVLSGLFALSTCTGIILLIILVAILRKKGKANTGNIDIPIKTEPNSAYEMMQQSNEIPLYSDIDANVEPIYDRIPEEEDGPTTSPSSLVSR